MVEYAVNRYLPVFSANCGVPEKRYWLVWVWSVIGQIFIHYKVYVFILLSAGKKSSLKLKLLDQVHFTLLINFIHSKIDILLTIKWHDGVYHDILHWHWFRHGSDPVSHCTLSPQYNKLAFIQI